jgi:hypothetical protein
MSTNFVEETTMQATWKDIVTLGLASKEVEFCQEMLKRQLEAREKAGATGYGASGIRTNQRFADGTIAREESPINHEDGLIGHLGAFAVFRHLFGVYEDEGRYEDARWHQDKNPLKGDPFDVPPYRIDVKTSKVRNEKLQKLAAKGHPSVHPGLQTNYNLAMPPKERKEDIAYIQVLVIPIDEDSWYLAKIMGWLPSTELPLEPITKPPFFNKLVVPSFKLRPIETFKKEEWMEPMKIGYRELGLAGALAPSRSPSLGGSFYVTFRGKCYPDAWAAYQSSRHGELSSEQEEALMTEILRARFQQHPKMLQALKSREGVKRLDSAVFYSFSSDEQIKDWYGQGHQSRFIRSLISAL